MEAQAWWWDYTWVKVGIYFFFTSTNVVSMSADILVPTAMLNKTNNGFPLQELNIKVMQILIKFQVQRFRYAFKIYCPIQPCPVLRLRIQTFLLTLGTRLSFQTVKCKLNDSQVIELILLLFWKQSFSFSHISPPSGWRPGQGLSVPSALWFFWVL